MNPRALSRWWLMTMLLGTIMPAGCDSDHTICAPDVPAARLTGCVRTGGNPADVTLYATRVDLPPGNFTLLTTTPAADGRYILDVPPGRYVLKLDNKSGPGTYYYTSGGPAYGSMVPDTLDVATGCSYGHLDFDLGALTVQVTLPDSSLDGESVKILLHRADGAGETWDTDFRWWESASIKGDGAELAATGVLPGRYQVELVLGYREYMCYCPWDGEHVWLPDADTAAQALWYEISTGEATDLTWTPVTGSAHLSGRIGGAWLELGMDSEPEISVIGTDSVTVMGRRRVEPDGTFDLVIYRPRPVKLLVTHKGMPRYVGGPDFGAATVFDLAPGSEISGIEDTPCAMTLDTSIPLATPFGAGNFEIYAADGQTLLGIVDGTTHLKTTSILPNLWPGEFLIRTVPQAESMGHTTWIPQWYPGVSDPAAAERVVLATDGEILSLSMTVLTGGSISGDITGHPDPRAWWYALATRADNPTVWGRDYIFGPWTDYLFTGIPDGQWKIGVCLVFAAVDTIWYPGTTDWDSASVITIENADSVLGIDIPLE